MAWSERQDLNLRPSAPKADALPNCATPRRISEPACVLPDSSSLLHSKAIIYERNTVVKKKRRPASRTGKPVLRKDNII